MLDRLMCFKANWIFFILFSMKSHKANNLVARKQVPFCSYFMVLSLHALFERITVCPNEAACSIAKCHFDNWVPAACHLATLSHGSRLVLCLLQFQ